MVGGEAEAGAGGLFSLGVAPFCDDATMLRVCLFLYDTV